MANLQDFRVKRGLIVANNTTLSGNASVSGNLAVVGITTHTGNTTFNGAVTVANTAAFVGGNVVFNSNTLVVDATNSRVAVNAASSTVAFYVQGAANVSTTFTTANLVANNISTTTAAVNTLTVSGSTNSSIGTSTFFVNPSLNRVGINTAAPDASLAVSGTANVSGAASFGNTSAFVGAATFSNTIAVTGATTLSSTVSVAGDVTIISGNVALSNTSKYFVGSITGTSNTTMRTVNPGSYLSGGGQLTSDITLNVNATPSNVGSTIVARNASGDFTAGTISATLSGTATYGTYSSYLLYGGSYRSATEANTASTIMARDTNGDTNARYFRGTATSALYADLAELYLADEDYPVGTVVTIGGEKEITAYSSEVSIRALGTISENPAYLMNSGLEGGLPVALKGRVPVRVLGTVRKNQGLGPSAVPGVATMASHNYFAIALQDYDNFGEEGIIEAVIL